MTSGAYIVATDADDLGKITMQAISLRIMLIRWNASGCGLICTGRCIITEPRRDTMIVKLLSNTSSLIALRTAFPELKFTFPKRENVYPNDCTWGTVEGEQKIIDTMITVFCKPVQVQSEEVIG